MKKIILSFIVALFASAVFAQVKVQAGFTNPICTIDVDSGNSDTWFDIPVISIRQFDASVLYEFPSENKASLVLGGDIGSDVWGLYSALDLGVYLPAFETKKADWQYRFLTKLGGTGWGFVSLYNQNCFDLIRTGKNSNGLYAGLGVTCSCRGFFCVDFSGGVVEAGKTQEVVIDTGLDFFVGWNF